LSTEAWLPWAVFVLDMFMVWSVVLLKTSGFCKSTLAALLAGKGFAAVLPRLSTRQTNNLEFSPLLSGSLRSAPPGTNCARFLKYNR